MGVSWDFRIIIIIIILFAAIFWYIFVWYPNLRITSFKGRLLSEVNTARKRNGINTLGRTKFLDGVARSHSTDMAFRRACDHNGFKSRQALIKDKTGKSHIGENCYKFPARRYTKRVAKQLVRGWLDSPGHRANMLNPDYRRTGIGIVVRKSYVYATQLFSD